MYKHVLHLFRRDLRLIDNTSLLHAANAEMVSVGFIFDPVQVNSNPYKSTRAVSFMCTSLEELAATIKQQGGAFNIWHGVPEIILGDLLKRASIDCVTVNSDYTPFSRARDEKIAEVCRKNGISFLSHHDALLTVPGEIVTGAGQPFKVFTPFYRAACQKSVARPQAFGQHIAFAKTLLPGAFGVINYDFLGFAQPMGSGALKAGREAGLEALKRVGTLADYEAQRDVPAIEEGTSHLSAHNKFGTVSIREVYWGIVDALGVAGKPLIRSLYWRDFFTHVLWAKPAVLGRPYQEQYGDLKWENDENKFAAWCAGKTGIPIVDAGMRQLNEIGYMHNRVRMITASFLVKDLHIDWQWGERYFAQRLVDYDPAVNNGNWQWVASTGCDAQPYFRIFNPWLQQKKFDPEALYIKKWVSELASVPAAVIHALYKGPVAEYVRPIVNHATESKKALAVYKKAASTSKK